MSNPDEDPPKNNPKKRKTQTQDKNKNKNKSRKINMPFFIDVTNSSNH